MRNLPICVAAAAALLFVLPAHALNKCVDAKGKVTYQEDPCAGQVRPPPPPAPGAQKSGPRPPDKGTKDGKSPAAKAAPKMAPAECERAAKQNEQKRAEILKLKPNDRAESWRSLARAERGHREACRGK